MNPLTVVAVCVCVCGGGGVTRARLQAQTVSEVHRQCPPKVVHVSPLPFIALNLVQGNLETKI